MVIVDESEQIAVIFDVISIVSAVATHETSEISVQLVYRPKWIRIVLQILCHRSRKRDPFYILFLHEKRVRSLAIIIHCRFESYMR